MSNYGKTLKPRVLSNSPALTPEQDAQFDAKLETFVVGCNRIIKTDQMFKDYVENGGKIALPIETVSIGGGARFIKINRSGGGIHCFVDRTNGDVLKAASSKAPAKGARGNLFDAHNGLGRMKWTGPEYNK